MKEVLKDLQISLDELLNILNDKFNIIISDSSVLDDLDDEIVNEVYTIIQNIEFGQMYSKMIGEQY